ncbi:ATP-grasp domain-containing protein [Thiothrix eikelboomii]|nr:ATP-grasp domain-containing protein [Thiothrix eikelboomii]
MTINILMIGYAKQTQTAHQIKTLQDLGAKVIVLDPYGQDGRYAALSWQGQQVRWQDQDISPTQINAVLVCAQAPDIPTEAAFRSTQHQHLNWDNWFQHYGLQRDRSDTLLSLLLMYEQAGIPLFNPPSQTLLSRRKPYQVSQLQAAGCQLPATLITNNPAEAKLFIEAQGDCIIKPAAGGSLTLSANQLLEQNALENLVAAPAILQERIHGEDLRIIVVKDTVVSCAAVGVPAGTIDFRGEQNYQQGKITYQEVSLPRLVELQCRRAAALLGLTYAGIDLKHTATGDYYLLECNSSPIYLDVELKLKHPITEALCLALINSA